MDEHFVMTLKARITWNATPADFFEEPFSIEFRAEEVSIGTGDIVAELTREEFESSPEIYEEVSKHISGLFEGAQVFGHREYELSEGTIEKDRHDGGSDLVLQVKAVGSVPVAGSLDIKMTDSEGKVVVDIRSHRIESRKEFAKQIASRRGTDPTFDAIIDSYINAVKDANDELIHLFEIRDAPASDFRGKANAIRALGISGTNWSKLGRLANSEPPTQGRHRGKEPSEIVTLPVMS